MKIWNQIKCLFLLGISLPVIAGIGTITEISNNPASILRQKTTLDGKKGTSVEMNDAVRTAQGKAGITFEDDTKVQITENSRLVIDDFVYDPKNKTGKLGMKVALGTVRYASGQIAKNSPQNVSVNTPTATISVRGTDFTASVDEIGRSTVILLPSCPPNWKVIDRDCKVGEISITNEIGTIILNQAFQATRVETPRSSLKSVILKLTDIEINNMIIVSPPKEFKEEKSSVKVNASGSLDVDFLAENKLINELDKVEKEIWQDKLSQNFLEQNFLVNVLDLINMQLAAQLNVLNTIDGKLLPDYNALTNVKIAVDDLSVQLCREDAGSNIACVQTPKTQNSLVSMVQGSFEVNNRVNQGGNTIITLRQSD